MTLTDHDATEDDALKIRQRGFASALDYLHDEALALGFHEAAHLIGCAAIAARDALGEPDPEVDDGLGSDLQPSTEPLHDTPEPP